jgi:hypothetical protein
MAGVTLSYLKILSRIVDQLGLKAPKIACEKRANGTFHAVIEVHLVSWTSRGFRGPREFKGTSSTSAREAIRKAAHDVVQRLEKSWIAKINDFRRKDLELWKKRVLEIAKACKEVAEERDELERDFTFVKNSHARLLIENVKMKEKMTRLKKKISCVMTTKEEVDNLITDNNGIKVEVRDPKKQL